MNFPIGYSGAGYIEHLKAYATSFFPPPSEANIPKSAIYYASTLVHEATHGLFYARGIPYNSKLRTRIEQICHEEEHRFLNHLGLTAESLAKLKNLRRFDAEAYQKQWSSTFFQRFRYTKREETQRSKQPARPEGT